jgi:phenylalanyl-tRNA synthetase alpha chain
VSGPHPSYEPKEAVALSADSLDVARSDATAAFADAGDLDALRAARTAHLGDRSPLGLANREIGSLPPEARKQAGQRINEVRSAVQAAYAEREAALERERDAHVLVAERVDVTLPPDEGRTAGARHPLTLIQEQVSDVFLGWGWEIAEGPEVEASWFNFDALNIPAEHPARAEQDTLYVAPAGSGVVLRTQTSPVQVRSMLTRELPIYIACPGRVFRADTTDATHLPVFSQVEGLVVDEGITMAHLKGTLDALARAMFGPGVVTRLRPSYFPFVEPGAEVDYRCYVCRGTGTVAAADPARSPAPGAEERCPTCKGEGWIEWGGCGMVAPAVLRACGITPTEDGGPWSGFAFGMGLERTVMARHGVGDIRDLIEGDVRLTLALGGTA